MRRALAAVVVLGSGAGCLWAGSGITATGPVTELGVGRICVRPVETDVPGRGCTEYPSEEAVAGIAVGDCVVMRMYSESVEFRDIRKTDCPAR